MATSTDGAASNASGGPIRAQLRDWVAGAEHRLKRALTRVGLGPPAPQLFPPGHYHSPVPRLDELEAREAELFRPRDTLPGIDVRAKEQRARVRSFAPLYAEQPFADRPQRGLRYGFHNDFYSYGDALFLHCMLRSTAPRRLIEVGCGHSSCVILDTRDRFLDGLDYTLVEPYPERLLRLVHKDDLSSLRLHRQPVQDVPLETFCALEAGDILFIDSTHVTRAGSDVNRLCLEVLPSLKAGVLVHLHDIFWPFEYPKEWIWEGRGWNEAYLVRALLTFSTAFEMVLFGNWLAQFERPLLEQTMPLVLRNPGGSLWLRRK